MSDDITKVRVNTAKRENIQDTYEQVISYNQQILKIEASYNKQLQILTQ